MISSTCRQSGCESPLSGDRVWCASGHFQRFERSVLPGGLTKEVTGITLELYRVREYLKLLTIEGPYDEVLIAHHNAIVEECQRIMKEWI